MISIIKWPGGTEICYFDTLQKAVSDQTWLDKILWPIDEKCAVLDVRASISFVRWSMCVLFADCARLNAETVAETVFDMIRMLALFADACDVLRDLCTGMNTATTGRGGSGYDGVSMPTTSTLGCCVAAKNDPSYSVIRGTRLESGGVHVCDVSWLSRDERGKSGQDSDAGGPCTKEHAVFAMPAVACL